jgi:uncharacterized protein (TIGR02284 family)
MDDKNTRMLKELVQIARDNADFYESAREEIKNPAMKDLFTRMAAAKRNLIQGLGARLALSGEEVPDSGTLAGNMRKLYADTLAALSSKDESVYVGQLEEAEDRLLEHLNEALQKLDDVAMREAVTAQLPQVRACHDEMRALKRRIDNQHDRAA